MLNTIGIDRLYYFASIKNLSNILNYGILSKMKLIQKEYLTFHLPMKKFNKSDIIDTFFYQIIL